MKKVLIYGLFLFALTAFFPISPTVFAQTSTRPTAPVNVGLLPSNPFYFLKEWGRGVKRALVADNLKKINLDLVILNEKVAEVQKLAAIAPNKTAAIASALADYRDSMKYLEGQLIGLKSAVGTPEMDRFLTKLVTSVLDHTVIFEDLAGVFSEEQIILEHLQQAEAAIVELLTTVPESFERPDLFRTRLNDIINSQEYEFRELKAAEILDRVSAALPDGLLRYQVETLKRDLLTRFQARISQGFDAALFPKTFLQPLVRLKLIDTVRRTVSDIEIKNQLTLVRQRLLEYVTANTMVDQAAARQALTQATAAVEKLRDQASLAAVREQASFYLRQAENFFDEEQYGNALNQAVLAVGVADEALWQARPRLASEAKGELAVVKKEFDRLMAAAEMAGLVRAEAQDVYALFDRAERLMVRASDRGGAGVQDIKALLATIEVQLR